MKLNRVEDTKCKNLRFILTVHAVPDIYRCEEKMGFCLTVNISFVELIKLKIK